MVLETAGEHIAVEVERALLDFQAQLRSAQLKRSSMAQSIGKAVRLLMAFPDTRANRAAVAAHRSIIEAALPIPSRQVWAALRAGRPVGGDGVLWVRATHPESRRLPPVIVVHGSAENGAD
jgi:hypothetical protein